MALRAEVVDLVGLEFVEQLDQRHRIGQVAVVQNKPGAGDMRIVVEVVDARGVEAGGAADDAMDFVAFFQQQFGEIGAVLTGDAGDECAFHKWAACVALRRARCNNFLGVTARPGSAWGSIGLSGNCDVD